MREERGGQAGGQHLARVHVHDAQRAQHPAQAQVAFQVQVAVVRAGAHLVAQGQLFVVHRVHQRREVFVAVAPGARDVRGITINLGARVDQQRTVAAGRLRVLVLVVQRGAVLVQADDAVVGRVQVGVAGRGQVGRVDAGFRSAGVEGGARGQVAGHGAALGGAHAVEFVGGLPGAVEVQVVDDRLRVVGFEAGQGRIRFAQDRALAGRGQVLAGFGGVADDPYVKLVHPETFGCGRRHMPVVVGLEIHQHRLAARRVGDPAGRMPGQRQPGLEVGVGLEGVGPVVEEFELLDPRWDQKVIEPALFQGAVRALLDCRQVRTI